MLARKRMQAPTAFAFVAFVAFVVFVVFMSTLVQQAPSLAQPHGIARRMVFTLWDFASHAGAG